MNTEYLVTGATGHLGTTLIEALTERGERVRALVLPGDAGAKRIGERCTVFEGDVCSAQSMRPFFAVEKGTRAVLLHCAGLVSIAQRPGPALFAVNVTGVQNVLALAEEYGVARTVYVSSVHALPEPPAGQTIRERRDFSPGSVHGAYAKSKAQATALAFAAAKRGLPVCVVHPSGILGPNDYGPGHLTQLLIDFCRGRLPAAVRGGYDFVDVRDVAGGVLAAAACGRAGEGYILSNRFYTLEELLYIFHDVTGCARTRLFLPRELARAAAPLAEGLAKAAHRPPLFTAYSLYTLGSNADFSHGKADRELGYRVRPMRETAADTWRFLKRTGML